MSNNNNNWFSLNKLLTGATAVVTGGIGLVILFFITRGRSKYKQRRFVEKKLFGPQISEGLIHPGDEDYDEKMRELWGGPPPIHWQKYCSEWPHRYGSIAKEKIAKFRLYEGITVAKIT